MATRIVIDGNAFYEIDEECERQRRKQKERGGGAGSKSTAEEVRGGKMRRDGY